MLLLSNNKIKYVANPQAPSKRGHCETEAQGVHSVTPLNIISFRA